MPVDESRWTLLTRQMSEIIPGQTFPFQESVQNLAVLFITHHIEIFISSNSDIYPLLQAEVLQSWMLPF